MKNKFIILNLKFKKVLTLNRSKSLSSGFTIIELLVVCSIIAILASMTIASYMQSQMKSRDSRRKADLETVSQAVIMFQAEYKTYPGAGTTPNSTTINVSFSTESTTTQFTKDLNNYLTPLPHDPKVSSGTSDYYYKKTANDYRVYSTLENSKESGYLQSPCLVGSQTYNYAVPVDECI